MSRPKERILNYELKTKNYELSNGPSVSLSYIMIFTEPGSRL
jgi:hypothetical protein